LPDALPICPLTIRLCLVPPYKSHREIVVDTPIWVWWKRTPRGGRKALEATYRQGQLVHEEGRYVNGVRQGRSLGFEIPHQEFAFRDLDHDRSVAHSPVLLKTLRVLARGREGRLRWRATVRRPRYHKNGPPLHDQHGTRNDGPGRAADADLPLA